MPRISVTVGNSRLDLEGPEPFIANYEESLNRMLDRLASDAATSTDSPPPAESESTPSHESGLGGLEFGEALQMLGSASGTDQILLAGKFVQDASEDRTFDTRDANQLLIDQSIKLANASNSMKRNLTRKRVFKVGGKFRVSRTGEEHLASLHKVDEGQSQ